ncbi:MAG: hypothetical protein KDA58_16965, partial [Planctomycetaceae bacterium]|nr:hypothetical protein [Planctomycetaceae bacterium]
MNPLEESSAHDPLLDRVRQGDTAAFGEYLERERERLTKYTATRLGAALRGKLEAADVVQEVCLDAVRSFSAIDFTNQQPFGWLCQLVERRVIDAHRRFNNQKRGAAEVPIQGQGQPGKEDG